LRVALVVLVVLVAALVVLRPRDEEQQHGALTVVVLQRVLALAYCMGLSLRPGFLWSYA